MLDLLCYYFQMMESSRLWFLLAMIVLSIGLSTALSDDQLEYFKQGTGTDALPGTDPAFYP